MSSARPTRKTPLGAILLLTFVASLGTGVQWSGISFIAKHDFGYGQAANFLLYIVTALVYIAAAFTSGPLTRKVSRLLSPRGLLALVFFLQACVCTLPLLFSGSWVLWAVACATSVLTAIFWPIIESYLSAGRYGAEMRRAMGWWNLSWTGAVAVALFLMAPLVDGERAVLAIVALIPVFLACMLIMVWMAPSPEVHEETRWKESITPEYRYLLRSARVLLPVSYILIGTLSPLMPYRLEEVGAAALVETPATATWMVARFAAMALMWKLAFWQGRWGTLLLGGTVLAGGFAVVAVAPSLPVMLVGLFAFGAAQGVVYFAAIYYAMSVGAGSVDSGGTHEALVGVGYAVGPMAALAGMHGPELLGSPPDTAGSPAGLVGAVGLVTAMAAIPAISPYLSVRRMRRTRASQGESTPNPRDPDGAPSPGPDLARSGGS